jgi:hypothetical protein
MDYFQMRDCLCKCYMRFLARLLMIDYFQMRDCLCKCCMRLLATLDDRLFSDDERLLK